MPSEEVNYVQRVDRMLNRWAGVKSSAQPKDRTRVEIGKASQNGDSGSFEVSTNATVVMGEIFSFVASDSTRAWSIPAALTNVPKNEYRVGLLVSRKILLCFPWELRWPALALGSYSQSCARIG